MNGCGGSKLVLQIRLEAAEYLAGLEMRAQDRHTRVGCERQQLVRYVETLGHQDDRHGHGEKGLERDLSRLVVERFQEADLRFTQHLDTVRRRALGKARQD